MSNANIWAPGSNNVPVADPNSQVKSQEFTATEGQTDFVLTQFTYHPNGGALSVMVNGVKRLASRVNETSTTTFSLLDPCEVGDKVEAVGNTEMASADSAAVIAVQAATDANNAKTAAQASQTAAANSATNAANSATAAATSANAAALSYDNFDDRFLGPKATDPTVDNDGNALVAGALYWNTTVGVMKAWNGTTLKWYSIGGTPTPQTLTDAATINWDWSAGNAVVSIAANRTLGNPTNANDGDYRTIRVARTGAFTLNAFGNKFKGLGLLSQSATTGYVDHFVFRYNGGNDTFELVGFRAHIEA